MSVLKRGTCRYYLNFSQILNVNMGYIDLQYDIDLIKMKHFHALYISLSDFPYENRKEEKRK